MLNIFLDKYFLGLFNVQKNSIYLK